MGRRHTVRPTTGTPTRTKPTNAVWVDARRAVTVTQERHTDHRTRHSSGIPYPEESTQKPVQHFAVQRARPASHCVCRSEHILCICPSSSLHRPKSRSLSSSPPSAPASSRLGCSLLAPQLLAATRSRPSGLRCRRLMMQPLGRCMADWPLLSPSRCAYLSRLERFSRPEEPTLCPSWHPPAPLRL